MLDCQSQGLPEQQTVNMSTIIFIEIYLHSSYNTPTIPTYQRQIFWNKALGHKPV